jgi:hypothetical protein
MFIRILIVWLISVYQGYNLFYDVFGNELQNSGHDYIGFIRLAQAKELEPFN